MGSSNVGEKISFPHRAFSTNMAAQIETASKLEAQPTAPVAPTAVPNTLSDHEVGENISKLGSYEEHPFTINIRLPGMGLMTLKTHSIGHCSERSVLELYAQGVHSSH